MARRVTYRTAAPRKLSVAILIATLGALLVAAGSFLPWATVDAGLLSVSKRGIDGDGAFTLALAGFALIVLIIDLCVPLARSTSSGLRALALLCGVLATVIAIIDARDIANRFSALQDLSVGVSIGSGLYVVAAGGIVTAVAAACALAQRAAGVE